MLRSVINKRLLRTLKSSVVLRRDFSVDLKRSDEEIEEKVRKILREELRNDENVRRIFQDESRIMKYRMMNDLGSNFIGCVCILGVALIIFPNVLCAFQ
jgi:hypothetical protein